mgnify:FL=1
MTPKETPKKSPSFALWEALFLPISHPSSTQMASNGIKRIRELEKNVDSNVQNTKGTAFLFFLRRHRSR